MTDFSYQLYSSRNFPPWGDTFTMLSKLGYRQVEGFGPLYDDASATRAALDAAGLSMPTAHVSLELLEQHPARVLDFASTLGIETIYCPYLQAEQRPADAAGYIAFGQRLQAIGATCRQAGLGFGWHNHDFEFQPLEDGSIPMQHILDSAPGISWEADIAWVARGGADPMDWIAREGRRITAVHIKDIAAPGECEDEDGWADVGYGELDWAGLMRALRQTPATFFVMEHDNPADAQRFAKRSIAFCNTL